MIQRCYHCHRYRRHRRWNSRGNPFRLSNTSCSCLKFTSGGHRPRINLTPCCSWKTSSGFNLCPKQCVCRSCILTIYHHGDQKTSRSGIGSSISTPGSRDVTPTDEITQRKINLSESSVLGNNIRSLSVVDKRQRWFPSCSPLFYLVCCACPKSNLCSLL